MGGTGAPGTPVRQQLFMAILDVSLFRVMMEILDLKDQKDQLALL